MTYIALAFPAEISEELFHQGLCRSLHPGEVSCCCVPLFSALLQIMASLPALFVPGSYVQNAYVSPII